MGICAVPKQGQNYLRTSKNNRNTTSKSQSQQNTYRPDKIYYKIVLGNYATISLYHGHFSHHQGEVLACFSTKNNIVYCDEIREYSAEPKNAINALRAEKNAINQLKIKKGCPFQKVIFCIIPEYTSFGNEDFSEQYAYEKTIRQLTRQFFHKYSNITIFLVNSSGEGSIIPNQTVISHIFKQLITGLDHQVQVSLVSQQMKMLQLIRYEILKSEGCTKVIRKWGKQVDSQAFVQSL